ncbi:TetR/AcrR family transcriptional regulator [uncultured Ferrovibrio sp.]|jgi:AcrR family transcriptional regulator|uniref:TetR/AcrR family transcriptional regulator n=1 Tax=uncultured Ferrovibrio sp. TaxID=1576913 RepID=UPI0026025A47|nr:TetR/AcrR family transcriptional regulator [uncultured Ferrovibrio sp.]
MSKGQQTRATILAEALRAASIEGFQGVTIGMLAERLKMSKSGLFAHFGSKEELEKAMLEEAAERFSNMVWQPALQAPRGRPRIEALFKNTIEWMLHNDAMPGGCVFMTWSNELDDKPGPVRDQLAEMQQRWQATVARSAQIAIQEGHFRPDLDPRQFAFEMQGIAMSMNYYRRLLQDSTAVRRAETAFADLLARSSVPDKQAADRQAPEKQRSLPVS